ncbi:hypothetical protein CRG98_020953 [Punica granatum]|uniref:Uncharacterized protein n=1 Tax=Punica granatum TaxID=22663 RepID=A0A2I0JQQ1_PUNGR|nr:hypothetical protein CRG98_020953 [Punica granatum]
MRAGHSRSWCRSVWGTYPLCVSHCKVKNLSVTSSLSLNFLVGSVDHLRLGKVIGYLVVPDYIAVVMAANKGWGREGSAKIRRRRDWAPLIPAVVASIAAAIVGPFLLRSLTR